MCQMVLNNEKNGVELYFESKPATSIISSLKEIGFRWHTAKKCWYAKQNLQTMAKANELSESNVEMPLKAIEEKTEENYILPCHLNIADSKETSFLNNHKEMYFKDCKMYAHCYTDSVVIIDLQNALKPGKTCQKWNIGQGRDDEIFCRMYNNGIKTFYDLFEAVKNGTLAEKISVSTEKSSETFSPFVKVNPIKTPAKWTKAHIWKAILSGQIWDGSTSYHYTDDYAYDYAENYGEGRGVDLIKLAKEIIESSCKGYSFHASEPNEKGNIEIGFYTYSYDGKTLVYNEKYNHEIKAKARQKKAESLENYNNDMKSKVITVDSSSIADFEPYTCEWIEKNGNTGRYEIKKDLMFGRNLFWYDDDENREEQRKDFISVEPYNIINDKFYSVSNFFNRPTDENVYNDKRVIDTGNWEHICTGLSLKEMLEEGKKFDTLQENNITFDTVRKDLTAHATGNAFWIGVPDERNYNKELFNLNAEEMKIEEYKKNEMSDYICVI